MSLDKWKKNLQEAKNNQPDFEEQENLHKVAERHDASRPPLHCIFVSEKG